MDKKKLDDFKKLKMAAKSFNIFNNFDNFNNFNTLVDLVELLPYVFTNFMKLLYYSQVWPPWSTQRLK